VPKPRTIAVRNAVLEALMADKERWWTIDEVHVRVSHEKRGAIENALKLLYMGANAMRRLRAIADMPPQGGRRPYEYIITPLGERLWRDVQARGGDA
jgi:hypothetical protein